MGQHDRQSFLGPRSEPDLQNTTVGLIGLGGGGSHVAQQLAHLGVGGYVLADGDIIDDTNLNRLVNGTLEDVKRKILKVHIAERAVRRVLRKPRISVQAKPWQEVADELKNCDVIIAALDSVVAKDELDRFCKRYLITLIDIGMDVHKVNGRYLIAGQVVLTSPGGPCLRCLGIVTEAALAAETRRYGAAGGNPQVVWPNGILASTAVGLFTQLIAPWHDSAPRTAYLEYDGNLHTIASSMRLSALHNHTCRHNAAHERGDPRFDVRKPPTRARLPVDATERQSWFQKLAGLLRKWTIA